MGTRTRWDSVIFRLFEHVWRFWRVRRWGREGTQLTNPPGTHEVSCLCGLPENAKEGLLVQCDSCKKWVHCKCYNLDEQTVGHDDYSFSCMTCLPRPVPTQSMLLTDTSKPLGNDGNYLTLQTTPLAQLGNHT